ncbi:cytochrome P450 [Sporodiniella umbellata]|nr:cytochrome P450 [Sporodiniella umbellata]
MISEVSKRFPTQPISACLFSIVPGRIFALRPSSVIRQINKWHKEIGPIYKLNIGEKLWIFVGEPHLAHKIFVENGNATSFRPYHYFITELYAKNHKLVNWLQECARLKLYRGVIAGQYNDSWKQNRKFVSNLLKSSSIDKYSDIGISETKILMEKFTTMAKNKEVFALQPKLQLFITNIISEIIWSRRFESSEDPDILKIYELLHLFILYSGLLIDSLTGIKKKLKKVEERLNHIRSEVIEKALSSEKHSIIKELNELQQSKLISEDDMGVIITDLFTAGSGSVIDTLHWSMVFLSQHPEIQDKLAQEMNEWKTKNPMRNMPDFHQDREDFPYSICVQKEVLRLRPPAPIGVPHACKEDLVIEEYLIPKGTMLVSSIMAMNYDPNIYEDPNVFRPERFMKNICEMDAAVKANIEKRDHFSFGWGRRICPGIHLAEVHIFNFFIHFFSKFTIHAENVSGITDLFGYREKGSVCKPVIQDFRVELREP